MSAESPARVADRESLLADLRGVLFELADGKLEGVEIDADGHLLDHGYIDSLSAVLFLSHIAERHGVEIDDVDLVERYYTLGLLVDHLVGAGS